MSPSSAAMVQAKIVKAGDAGLTKDMSCAEIFASFEPPIVFGSHKELSAKLKKSGYQAEHAPPCSNFHVSGRSGPTVSGCEGYSTSQAFTWNAYDNQTATTEHKFMTDQMRQYGQSLGDKTATLKDWSDKYQKAVEDCLGAENGRACKPPEQRAALAKAAAECIRAAMDAAFAEMGISPDTQLRNGISSGPPPAPQPPAGTATSVDV